MAAMKTSKKMKGGFMCHSAAATAVCKASDHRSVIVPRRTDHRTSMIYDNSRLSNTAVTACTRSKYSRLVDSPLFLPPAANAVIRKSINNGDEQHNRPSVQKPNSLSLMASSSSDQVFQVVVMRVALHCQGCAGKLKKHLSKMEGVTSFSIDLDTKRVTVMGHVSPVGVLESISKVKRAEFWP